MSNPLILKGNLTVNGVDMSDSVTSFMLKGNREVIDIPATFGSSKTFAGGTDSYEVDVNYWTNTATPSQLTGLFWAAIADDEGTVELSGTFGTGAVSPANPEYTFTALVTGVGIGGDVNTLATDSQTFPVIGRPSISTS